MSSKNRFASLKIPGLAFLSLDELGVCNDEDAPHPLVESLNEVFENLGTEEVIDMIETGECDFVSLSMQENLPRTSTEFSISEGWSAHICVEDDYVYLFESRLYQDEDGYDCFAIENFCVAANGPLQYASICNAIGGQVLNERLDSLLSNFSCVASESVLEVVDRAICSVPRLRACFESRHLQQVADVAADEYRGEVLRRKPRI